MIHKTVYGEHLNMKKICGKNEKKQGTVFIVSAPSGAGKTTLCNAVCDRFKSIVYSVSYTTRKPRPGELDGKDYHFVSADIFKKMIKEDRFAEWAEVYGNFYGTSLELINRNLTSGKDILFDIDVQGTIQLLEKYPDSITIFIMPPSLDKLRERLKSRGADDNQSILRRIESAENEIKKKNIYKHIIINDILDNAVKDLMKIIEKHHRPKAIKFE